MESQSIVLETKGLRKYFPHGEGLLRRKKSYVKAVDGVDLTVSRGETLGLVGESGCGKSTLARLILRLIEPTTGQVNFHGVDMTRVGRKELGGFRKRMQIIFQDPYASLNPRLTVDSIIGEALSAAGMSRNKSRRRERIGELLELVGLPAHQMHRYPHEFSGGQRQRIGIARALAVDPEFIVADEPISALDVSVRAQILNLMVELQEKRQLTYLFIAHDLGIVKHVSDRVAVMYLGQIVELTRTEELFRNPLHPYTMALLSAQPKTDPTVKRERIVPKGEVPSPLNPPEACRFHPRCPYAKELCSNKEPEFREVGAGHFVKCHFAEDFVGTISMDAITHGGLN